MAQAAERVVAAADGKDIPSGDGLGDSGKWAAGAAGAAGVAGVVASVGDKVGHAAEGVVDVVKTATTGVVDLAEEAVEAVGDIAGGSVEAAKGMVAGVAHLGEKAAHGTVDTVKHAAEGVAGLAGEAVGAVGDIAEGSVEAVKELVTDTDKVIGGAAASATAAGAAALGASTQTVEKSAGWVKRFWWWLPLALLLGWLLSQCGGKKPHDMPPPPPSAQGQASPGAAPPPPPAPVKGLDVAVLDLFKSKGANIVFAGNKLSLSGEVADQATKDELLAKAKAVLASLGANVTLDDKLFVKGASASAGAQLLKVNFASGSSQIPASAFEELNRFVATAKKDAYKGEISGHTDNTGDAVANVVLSDARAKAVVAYLVKQGVAANALTAKGYGADKPIADNATDDGRARNRRVEFAPAK